MNKIQFHLHGGSVISASDGFSDEFERSLRLVGCRGVRYMRVGRFSVVVLSDGRLAIARQYKERVCDDGSIRPGDRFWEDWVSDRSRQLDEVETRLNGHPLEASVREDIALERQSLDR